MTKISEKILKTIDKENVKPAPKWKFLVKNWFVWIMFGLALLIGALFFAVILDILINHDWDICYYLHKTFIQYLLLSLPYVWIVLLMLFSWVAYYDFIHIRGWYRHRVYLVVGASVFLSAGCGVCFFYAGLGKVVEHAFADKVPFYGLVKMDKDELWNHPEEGLLRGSVIEIKNEEEFVLEDVAGKQWKVKDINVKLEGKKVNKGEGVEMFGNKKNDDEFIAEKIRETDYEKKDSHEKRKSEADASCDHEDGCGDSSNED